MDRSTSFTTEAEAFAIPAPTGKTHCEHWSSVDPGFGLRILRARAKDGRVTRRWLFRFYEGGKDYRITLGAVGRITWDKARHLALTKRLQVIGRRERGIVALTFADAYAKYVRMRKRDWAPDTRLNYEKSFALLEEYLGEKRIDEITEDDVEDVYVKIRDRIADGLPKNSGKPRKSTKSKSSKPRKRSANHTGEATAVSAMRLANSIFIAEHRVVVDNPCDAMSNRGLFNRRDPRVSQVTLKQLPAFWKWLHYRASLPVRDLILCTLLMALRKSIAGKLEWANLIEAEGRFVYLMKPDERGNKRKMIAPIPVPSYLAKTVFIPRRDSPFKHKRWIIESPRRAGEPLCSIRGSLARLKKDTGIDICMHDLRRTICSAVVRTSDLTTAKRVLTHSLNAAEDRGASTAGYFVGDYDDMRRAMNRAVAYIRKRAGDFPAPPPAPSVPEPNVDFESDLVDLEAEKELLAELEGIDDEGDG